LKPRSTTDTDLRSEEQFPRRGAPLWSPVPRGEIVVGQDGRPQGCAPTEDDPAKITSPNASRYDKMIADHISHVILEGIAEVLKVHESIIQEERNFPEYGVDSVVAIKLIKVINEKLGLTLQTTALFDYNNIKQLRQYILQAHKETLRSALQESNQPV